MLKPNFEKPLGKIVSGLYVLTAQHEGKLTGTLTSFVIQTGFDPPTVGISLNKDRYIYELVKKSGRSVLNIVGENQVNLLKHFSKRFQPDEEVFSDVKLKKISEYGPVLDSSVGYLELELMGEFQLNDHIFVFSKITGGEELNDEMKPWVHIRKNGMHY
ncbi:MAG: hypothetical protein A3H98_04890 [Bacteroidetes bacterium RIFCSPLOWO2_02_FULL_36_8]|nr:MAG: hypothetical protein A3H98_04890 [Bacteroidetes bacterium RIFCSPLOWO2_02_FULL_36_8]OFY72015.1 MAG: hypothetical protein A3G23_00270 [Bacteroidetes bacterium RIFCSPLOWO2_12_FULL_37_12]